MMRYSESAMPAKEQIIVNKGLVIRSLSNLIPPKTPNAITAPISNARLV